MTAPYAGLIELLLVLGAVLALGVRELYSLRREKRRAREKAETGEPPANDQKNRRGMR